MEQHTDLARLRRSTAIPLTKLAQRTGATIADTSCIHHAQTSVGFSTPFLGVKRLSCWTAQRPIRLERKVCPEKRPVFQEVAAVGGPYPEVDTDESGCAATSSPWGGKAGARLGDAQRS